MSRFIRRLPSPALVLSVFAIVLALVGTSFAAGLSLRVFNKNALLQTVGAGPLVYVRAQSTIPAHAILPVAVATCPSGRHVVGGGIKVSTGGQNIEGVVDTFPVGGSGWGGTVSNFSGTESHTAITTAICAKSGKATGSLGRVR
jgi:hypothetical protein